MSIRLVRAYVGNLLDNALALVSSGDFSGIFRGNYVVLFQAWPGWSPDLVLSDLTLANFTGAARVAVTWGTRFIGAGGRPTTIGNQCDFTASDAVTPNQIIGAALVSASSGGNLIGAEAFDTPVAMDAAGKVLAYTPQIQFDPTWLFGVGIVQA